MSTTLPRITRVLVVLIVTITVTGTIFAELRTWKDATGKFSIEAEFAGIIAGDVRLKKADGSAVSVSLDRLSEADREWIKGEIERPKPRIRAITKEDREEMEKAKLEAEIADEEKRREEAEKQWLREGYELPEDIKSFYEFDVEGGKFAVALSTPVAYSTDQGSIGADVLHVFWDGETVHNGAAEAYEANGKSHRIWYQRTERIGGAIWWRPVLFGEHRCDVKYARLRSPVNVGLSVASVVKKLGEPDDKQSLSLGSQIWTYDRFPYLEIWIREGRVSLLTCGPRDGEAALRKWVDEHQSNPVDTDDAEIEEIFRQYLKNGYKVPDDWTSFHTFEVDGGTFVVATTSPVHYLNRSKKPIGGEICHAFWDGERIQDYSAGHYEVNGQKLLVRSTYQPESRPDGRDEYVLEFNGNRFTIPVIALVSPVTQGQSVGSVLETLGVPDRKQKGDDDGEQWFYERFPFLAISIDNNAVTKLEGSPQPGLVKLLTWMAQRGYELEAK